MIRASSPRLAAAAIAALSSAPALAGDDEFEADRVVVRITSSANIDDLARDYAAPVIDAVPARGLYLLDVPDSIEEEEFAQQLSLDPRVIFAERNFFARDPGPGTQSFYLASSAPEYRRQYAIPLARFPQAHRRATGLGVVVAVLDTGLDAAHPALSGRVAPGGYNFVENNTDTSDSPDSLDSDDDGQFDEMVGHGTFVASLIALAAPDAPILPVRVLDSDGVGTSFRVARGIDHALLAGARVLNLSLGALDANPVLDEAVRWAQDAGIPVFAAAGNEGHDSPPWSPAVIPFAFAVAATDRHDVRADFTNYGKHIDLCAPGVDIISALPGDRYGVANGTSYACPLVAATAALLLQQNPNLTPDNIALAITSAAASIAKQNPGFDGRLGAGRLDAAAALGVTCPADFNADALVNSSDFFEFIPAFFAQDPAADLDASGTVDSQDFFEFLRHFFTPC